MKCDCLSTDLSFSSASWKDTPEKLLVSCCLCPIPGILVPCPWIHQSIQVEEIRNWKQWPCFPYYRSILLWISISFIKSSPHSQDPHLTFRGQLGVALTFNFTNAEVRGYDPLTAKVTSSHVFRAQPRLAEGALSNYWVIEQGASLLQQA